MTLQRRSFIIQSAAACASVLAAQRAVAQASMSGDMVSASDPTAMALGYVPDATKADKKKYPSYVAGQRCGVCVLFDGKAADTTGGCPLFPGKRVAAAGWCSSWAKKV